MSGYFFASAIAAELMAPSHPWSAAGPEKPMTMVSPVASLSALFVGPVSVGPPVVQPVSSAATARVAPPAMSIRCDSLRVASMYFLLVDVNCSFSIANEEVASASLDGLAEAQGAFCITGPH
jgi:hypothetical protein